MNQTGVESLHNGSQVCEGLVRPAGPEQPFVQVRENRDSGFFEAVFALELTAVGCSRSRDDARLAGMGVQTVAGGDRHLSSLLEKMVVGQQQIDFVYSGGNQDVRGAYFNWKLLSRSTGANPEIAVSLAGELWRNLNVILAAQKAYLLTPVATSRELEKPNIESKWRGTIQPTGIAIAAGRQRPLGFSLQAGFADNQSSVVLIPEAPENTMKSLDSVVAGALGCPGPVTVVLSLAPFRLSANDLRKVRGALEWLRDGEVKGIRYHEEIEEGVEEVEDLNRLRHNLELWIKNPSGFRVSCSAFSDEPIPPAFLAMVGGEVFHGCPVAIRVEKNETTDTLPMERKQSHGTLGPHTLDLRDCINGSLAAPPVFPNVSTLLEAGVNRFYPHSHLNLSETGLLLGRAGEGRLEKDVRFAETDRSRHCYIIGATGTGKSTLLYNMIVQDIENGKGIALIDPHGDLYEQVLESIPGRRVKDVVLVNPCDFEHPVGINFLECDGPNRPVQINFIVNEMIKIYERLYDLRIAGGPMFEQYMRNALLLLTESDFPATLMEVPMLFEDKEFRRFLKSRCKNPFVESFWSNIAEKAHGDASLENMAPYITSKLNLFTANALISPIIGQGRSTVNFREVMDEGKILLVNLSKGILGELDVQLLGMLLIGKIFSAAMSRAALRPEVRRPLYLYVDEFQNFTTDTTAFLLSEARKFGLHLTLANQNLAQLSANSGKQNLLDAVLGNTGTTLIFRLGAVDAERMQVYTKPELQARDLQDLPDFHVAGRLLTRNRPSRAFVFKTLPMVQNTSGTGVKRVISASRKRYTVPRQKVEEEILRRRSSYQQIRC